MANSKKIKPFFGGKNGKDNKILSFIRAFAVYLLIGLAALVFFTGMSGGSSLGTEIPISQVISDIKDQKVDKILWPLRKTSAIRKKSSNATLLLTVVDWPPMFQVRIFLLLFSR